jgi:DNA (cytosine-5)-methyltransferase 1
VIAGGTKVNELTHLDLCTGGGGFSIAAEWAGFTTIGIAEINPYLCSFVLPYLFAGLRNYGDIRTANWSAVRDVCLLTAGYPCQPFSYAGKRRGETDDRHIWSAVLRAIETIRPSWVCCENVNGHVTMGLDSVLSDLEGAGYAAQPLVIPAAGVGAWHRRERVWIISHANFNNGHPGKQGEPSESEVQEKRKEALSGCAQRLHPDADFFHGHDRRHDSANVVRQRQGQTEATKRAYAHANSDWIAKRLPNYSNCPKVLSMEFSVKGLGHDNMDAGS